MEREDGEEQVILTQKAKPATTPARAPGEKVKHSGGDRAVLVCGKLGSVKSLR